jgi:NDP-sugar pyrophosphorylase family protein
MQGVILAAGKGKRLHPITTQRSKAMAPVAGKPMVARVLDTLLQNGLRDLIMLVSPDDQEITPYFRQMTTEATFRFVVQPQRLGMAHALQLAAPYLTGPFVMSACDNLTPAEHVAALLAQRRSSAADAALSLMAIDIAQAGSTGIVEWRDGLIRRIVEKPKPAEAPSNISSLPLYVFSPHILDYLSRVKLSPRGEYELQDAIQMLIDDGGRVTGVLTPHRVQLTNVADLLALNRHYLETDSEADQVLTTQIGPGTRLIAPLRIEPDCTIGANATIGPYVYLEQGCQVGDHAMLRNVVALRNTIIPAYTRVQEDVLLPNHG